MKELLEKGLCSLEPDHFDDSIKVLQKQPDSLKEMIEIQERLDDVYKEATIRLKEIKEKLNEEELEKALLEIEKDVKKAEADALDAEQQVMVKAVLDEQDKLEEMYEKKKQLEAALDFVNGKIDPGKGKQRTADKIYPNDPCPCGSGKKYKRCCGRFS